MKVRQTCGDYVAADGRWQQCLAHADFVCDPRPDDPWRKFPLCAAHADRFEDVRPMRDDERAPVKEPAPKPKRLTPKSKAADVVVALDDVMKALDA